MGAVDQNYVKSSSMSLASERVDAWYKKQIPYLVESAVIWAHANYNLDKSTEKQEHFNEWYGNFLAELVDMSPNLRIRKLKIETPNESGEKRSHKKKTPKSRVGKIRYGYPSEAGINCYGRKLLESFLDSIQRMKLASHIGLKEDE